MDIPSAIALISEVEVKKVTVRLSLSGVERGASLVDCLWPRVTFSCNGIEKTFPFTYWRTLRDSGTKQDKPGSMINGNSATKTMDHTFVDIAFLAAGLRPKTRPIIVYDAAEAKGKLLYKTVYQKVIAAAKKKSFIDRHIAFMRKIERADGKRQLRELLLKLPHRLEKRDVVEAWEEAVVTKVMDS